MLGPATNWVERERWMTKARALACTIDVEQHTNEHNTMRNIEAHSYTMKDID